MRLAGWAALLLLAAPAGIARAAGVSLSFDKEPAVVKTSATIQAAAGAYADPQRVYYIRDSSAVFSATTGDGAALAEEAGVRLSSLTVPSVDIAISSITGLSLLPLTAGGFRMAYSVVGTTGAFNIYTATSADGLAWANDTGTAVMGGTTFVGYPSLAKLTSGDWAMFYIGSSAPGNSPDAHEIYEALSTNQGRNWRKLGAVVAQRADQVAATVLTDNDVRLYYTAPLTKGASDTLVLSALSSDSSANSFSVESGVRLSTSPGSLSSLFVERTTDTFRWRLYYDYDPVGLSTGDAYAAVTDAPQPGSVFPPQIMTTSPDYNLAVSGEIFSTTGLAAVLKQGGQPDIPGTGLARTNDQSFTAAFATQGAATGFWDLEVTNGNGLSTTLRNALFIDFPGGNVSLTDNLLRPRQGTRTRIDITTFASGHITVKLYTIDGRPVSTIFDAEQPAGTLTVYWNGTTATGATVASGLYLLHCRGPKLDAIDKIVVIK
ncbi:MAG: hypothetical protein KGO96_04310 [Elusimicrobia bacterium]|nr:hypothetical protein [Elusimicrobiota bacterium]MDE2237035.1 hypothetical protein [Elusimicrobiota bacterium]MDE2425116.1 hypothetical protein [Elusimicrobiota bacterium]